MSLVSKITAKDLEKLGLVQPKQKSVETPKVELAPPPAPKVEEPVLPKVEEPQFHGESQYPADLIDETGPLRSDWQKMDFASSAQLVATLDRFINSGRVDLHPWQIEVSEDLCIKQKPDSQNPFKFALCAANGSGKDKYVIAPFAIWFALTKIKARVIITSSSGTQLTSQTETYIRDLAEAANTFFDGPIFHIRQRFIRCNLSGSEIRLFATDEAGKAEGYHPLEPESEMAIIINEAKSVHEDIFGALRRCTGFNYWLEVSTPGEPVGHFYYSYTNWPNTRKVTSYDCPHLSASEREEDKRELGETSPLYRSKHLAEFTSLGGQVVIPREMLQKIKNQPAPANKWAHWKRRVGIDLAAGGDENSIYIVQGNRVVAENHFREFDTTLTAAFILEFLAQNRIPKDHEEIFIDDGNVGHSITDMLKPLYPNIVRVINQSTAINKRMFGNRGAENWFRVMRLFEQGILPCPTGEIIFEQLTGRKYKRSETGARVYLQSKKEAKAEGLKSPDRADAYVLCFSGLSVESFLADATDEKAEKKQGVSADALQKFYEDNVTFAENNQRKREPIHGSLQLALKYEYSESN